MSSPHSLNIRWLRHLYLSLKLERRGLQNWETSLSFILSIRYFRPMFRSLFSLTYWEFIIPPLLSKVMRVLVWSKWKLLESFFSFPQLLHLFHKMVNVIVLWDYNISNPLPRTLLQFLLPQITHIKCRLFLLRSEHFRENVKRFFKVKVYNRISKELIPFEQVVLLLILFTFSLGSVLCQKPNFHSLLRVFK